MDSSMDSGSFAQTDNFQADYSQQNSAPSQDLYVQEQILEQNVNVDYSQQEYNCYVQQEENFSLEVDVSFSQQGEYYSQVGDGSQLENQGQGTYIQQQQIQAIYSQQQGNPENCYQQPGYNVMGGDPGQLENGNSGNSSQQPGYTGNYPQQQQPRMMGGYNNQQQQPGKMGGYGQQQPPPQQPPGKMGGNKQQQPYPPGKMGGFNNQQQQQPGKAGGFNQQQPGKMGGYDQQQQTGKMGGHNQQQQFGKMGGYNQQQHGHVKMGGYGQKQQPGNPNMGGFPQQQPQHEGGMGGLSQQPVNMYMGNFYQQGPVKTPPPQWNTPQGGYSQQPGPMGDNINPQQASYSSQNNGALYPPDAPPNSDQWRSGIFDGGKDLTTFCIGAWLPCVLIGQVVEIVDHGNTRCFSAGAIWWLIQVHTLCGFLYTAPYRRRLRAKFGLPESPMPDVLTELLCQQCSACQMYYELKSRGCDPQSGYQAVKHIYDGPQKPPTQQQMMR